MGDEIRVQPSELAQLAQTTLEMSTDIADAWRDAQADAHVPAAAFGRLPAGARIYAEMQSALDDADVVTGRQVAVYETDVDLLLRVAFSYQETDAASAARFRPS